jgi:hypothetical protein
MPGVYNVAVEQHDRGQREGVAVSLPRYAQRSLRSLAVGVLILLAILLLHQLRRPAAEPLYQDLDALMTAHAGDAVDRAAKDFGTRLDYTPESVQQVEAILAQLHERHVRQPLSDRERGREARLWGAYIGAVIKRLRPCTWKRDSTVAGEAALPLVFPDGSETYPCSWTSKRISNGESDNVALKFKFLIVNRDKPNYGLETKDGR